MSNTCVYMKQVYDDNISQSLCGTRLKYFALLLDASPSSTTMLSIYRGGKWLPTEDTLT